MPNIILDTFTKGGFFMWPLLATSITSAAVTVERAIWWSRTGLRKETTKLDRVYTAIEEGNLKQASQLARDSKDPVLQVVYHGLNHHHTSLQNALQVSAGLQIESAGRFLGILDTIITLAPLLGLLGTVTGIMHAFSFLGNEELQAIKVSGGVAEALIATAFGLLVAILTLIPYNYFSNRVGKFTFALQTAATNVEVLVESSKTLPTHEAALASVA